MLKHEDASPTTTATEPQLNLAPLPANIENEETEIQAIIKATTQEALQRTPNVTVDQVKRVLEARAELINTIRDIAIKVTAPEDWTLYRARDGSVMGVPTAAAAMKMRRWAGVSVMNHRGMDGAMNPSVRQIKNSVHQDVTVIEGYADGICGRDTMPGIYFSVRSDDQFIGRAGADTPRKGGPRTEDLMSCWRTGIDSKVVRCMTGTTKVSSHELEKLLGKEELKRCVKGSGFGTASERAAGSVAEGGVKEMADALWKDILRAVNGNAGDAKSVLKECTSYPAFKGRDGSEVKAFAGIDSPDKFTTADKVRRAADKFQKHPQYVPPPPDVPADDESEGR
jgi:hypothetical protein